MNSNREMCILARRAIIEHVALLYSGILLFRAEGHHRIRVTIWPTTWLAGMEALFHIQISMEADEFKP